LQGFARIELAKHEKKKKPGGPNREAGVKTDTLLYSVQKERIRGYRSEGALYDPGAPATDAFRGLLGSLPQCTVCTHLAAVTQQRKTSERVY